MAKDSDHLAGARDADNSGGLLSGLLAEENEFDRRSLWRIGSWGFGAVGAVFIAVMANQSSLGWRREQVAAADLARQAQQLQALARDSRNETRQLASAIDTLNSDRDRLYSRVTVLEQGLDSVTGAIAKQSAAASAPQPAASNMPAGASPALDGQPAPQTQAPPPAPIVGPVASMSPPSPPEKSRDTAKPAPNASTALTAAAEKPREAAKPTSNVAMAIPVPAPAAAPASASAPTPLGPAKSMMGPPDPAAPKMIEPPKETAKPSAAAMAAVPPEAPQSAKEPLASDADAPQAAIQRTEFAVDLGSASSIGGLRALWRGILKTNAELAALHPIIVIKESTTGLGMQLRLAAGPLQDAAAAAKICAALLESQRGCETTVFDGQRLAMAADEAQPDAKGDAKRDAKGPPAIKPVPAKRGYYPKHAKDDTPPKAEGSTLSSWFGSASAKK
jgi:hypothetical protein